MSSSPLLSVENLHLQFHTRRGTSHAVNGVSFDVHPGEIVGIVGESGSGKSVTCYSILGLVPTPPGKITQGKAVFDGTDLLQLNKKELRQYRGKEISVIFQDPMTSLNPYLKIGTQLVEPLQIHENLRGKKAQNRAIEMLKKVGIPNPEQRFHSYPHEFSGGMRQRVMIAMALITNPRLLICDEPTTALDVTVQRQVLELIQSLQKELNTAVIFITHDLAVVSKICDSIHVMYAGRFVESAPARKLFSNPRHAYTRSLLASIPAAHKKDEALTNIPGLPPDPLHPICGCAFAPRNVIGDASLCPQDGTPPFVQIAENHYVQDCPGCLV